eukprot:m.917505 g.917505  ORF g.917505 m.917505 type:complete len:302 (+) comp60172_c0_seq13:13505-14410(+)
MTGREFLDPVDRWMLSRLSACVSAVDSALHSHALAAATSAVHHLWVYEFCDFYLEHAKDFLRADVSEQSAADKRAILLQVVETGLHLLSPFMPFITEELYQRLPRTRDHAPSICVSPFPKVDDFASARDSAAEAAVTRAQAVIHTIRASPIKALVPPSATRVHLVVKDDEHFRAIESLSSFIQKLSKCASVSIVKDVALVPKGCLPSVCDDAVQVHIEAVNVVSLEVINREEQRLSKRKQKLEQQLAKVVTRTSAESYAKQAPTQTQAKDEQAKQEMSNELSELANSISQMSALGELLARV